MLKNLGELKKFITEEIESVHLKDETCCIELTDAECKNIIKALKWYAVCGEMPTIRQYIDLTEKFGRAYIAKSE